MSRDQRRTNSRLTTAKAHPSHVSEALFITSGGRFLNHGRKMLTAHWGRGETSAGVEGEERLKNLTLESAVHDQHLKGRRELDNEH